MIDKFKLFFDKNVFLRIITGIFFIVPFIFFIINGSYLFIFYFLLLLSILIHELSNATINKTSFNLRFILSLILIFIIFYFILLRISNDNSIIYYLLYIIFSIWIFDSFSLIGGKLIGGKKLMPTISPNKTYSGLLIGFLSLFIYSAITTYIYNINYVLILSTFIIGLISFLGDALQSYFKRYLKIKDFSNLLPGHGGLLDRMDAFLLIFFIHFIVISLDIIQISLYD